MMAWTEAIAAAVVASGGKSYRTKPRPRRVPAGINPAARCSCDEPPGLSRRFCTLALSDCHQLFLKRESDR